MPEGFEGASFENAIARLPRWILLLAACGTAIAGSFFGLSSAAGFLAGSIAAYVNFRIVERTVNRVARLAGEGAANSGASRPGGRTGAWLLFQFLSLVLGAFVILRYSGFSMAAAFCGFLVCPAAVVLEIIFELVTYDHS
ncbi:MAG: hypothetical protein ABSB15_05275 [Bryobacteraceae bacterium]